MGELSRRAGGWELWHKAGRDVRFALIPKKSFLGKEYFITSQSHYLYIY